VEKTPYESVCFTRIGEFTWRVSDFEEFVGFTASLHLQTFQWCLLLCYILWWSVPHHHSHICLIIHLSS